MPSANKAKAVFDHGKTSSYHIKSIADCQQSQKSSAFKLVLNRASGNKRYDFEAESPKMAGMCLFDLLLVVYVHVSLAVCHGWNGANICTRSMIMMHALLVLPLFVSAIHLY